MVHLEIASEHFNIETDLDLLNYRQQLANEKEQFEANFQPSDDFLEEVKSRSAELGEPQFDDPMYSEDCALSFEYFLNVNKVIVECALKQVETLLNELKEQRREALESYEDELFDDLVLQTVLVEHKAIEILRDIVYPEVDLRPRDLIKAKVKYLMDPVQNAKFEAELQVLKVSLKSTSIEAPEEITEDKVLSSWRTLE